MKDYFISFTYLNDRGTRVYANQISKLKDTLMESDIIALEQEITNKLANTARKKVNILNITRINE